MLKANAYFSTTLISQKEIVCDLSEDEAKIRVIVK